MGVCLATDPDLLADLDSETETAASNQFAQDCDPTTDEELPLWRATRVEVPDWPESPVEVEEIPSMTRHFWRVIVARWPIELRQQWGDRANELQDSGLDWKLAERTAFEQIMQVRKKSQYRRRQPQVG